MDGMMAILFQRSFWTWPRIRQALLIVLALIVVVKAVVAVGFRENDFSWHRRGGEAFLNGTNAGFENYPVPRMMLNTLIAIGPALPTRLIVYVLAIGLLYLTYRMWRAMARDQGAMSPFWDEMAGIGAIFMFLQILFRDLDECGLQLILLFLLTAGGYALMTGKAVQAGFWLAVATLYKFSPILTLPFLLWKRQWRAAAAQVVFTAALSLLPILYLGAERTWQLNQAFADTAWRIMQTKSAYPHYLEREAPKPQNLSLQAMLARYVQRFPADHPVYQPTPWFIQFGQLEGLSAYYTVRGLMLGMALLLAWYFWPRAGSPVMTSAEWAIVCLMCTLTAPLCWKQHLVLGLPLAFLLMRQLAMQPSRARTTAIALMSLVILVPIYAVFGRQGGVLWASYKFETMTLLGMIILVISHRKQAASLVTGDIEPVHAGYQHAA